MVILFDHGTPRGIARALENHTVKLAKEEGWDRLSNGDLLTAAENAGFDVLLTTDQGIEHQQNLINRKIAVVILGSAVAGNQDDATPSSRRLGGGQTR